MMLTLYLSCWSISQSRILNEEKTRWNHKFIHVNYPTGRMNHFLFATSDRQASNYSVFWSWRSVKLVYKYLQCFIKISWRILTFDIWFAKAKLKPLCLSQSVAQYNFRHWTLSKLTMNFLHNSTKLCQAHDKNEKNVLKAACKFHFIKTVSSDKS